MAQPSQKKEVLSLTTDLTKKLTKAFPQYKGLSEKDFFSLLGQIEDVESQGKNIYQLNGGPGRGYYQVELRTAPVAYNRALTIQKELKERGIDITLPRFEKDFTKLTKDEQAFYALSNMVGAAAAKRLQGEKDYYLNPKNPKKMWLDLHWAGSAEDKAARSKHWEETHGKEALVPQKIKTLKQEITKPTLQPVPQAKKVQAQVEQEIEQPDLHPAGPEKTTLSAPPMLSDKKVKQLTNAKFVPNAMGIPIFTEKGTFAWDKPQGELDILLHGRPGPTMRRAKAMDNAEAVQFPTYAQGGKVDKYKSIPRTGLRYPKIVNLPSGKRSYYSPEDETIYMAAGEDPTVLQHEMFHHWQNLNNQLSVGPVAKAPMMAQNPGDWYNRRQADMQDASSKFLKKNPSFVNVPFNLLYDKEVEPAMYNYPEYAEGEAEEYQNYVQRGGQSVFPEYAKGGPVYNWIPPNYPRVGARNEQGGWLDQYADGGDTNPLMNIPESQRFAPTLQRTVTYPEGFIEDKLNPGVPLNFMGQPFATGAIEESMSPLDLIGGVRGGMGLIKGAMKYKQAMKPNYIQIGDKLFNMGPHPRAVRRATKQMHKGVRDIVLPSAFENGGDVPHDYMYSQGNVSSYRPGTSIHPIGITNVPDSPCGPGFTIQYNETGNPVCMPIAELAPLAGASQTDYDLFNPAVYNQSPLETYSVERTTRGRNKEERFKPTKEEKQATRKAIKASSLHRRPFLSGVGQFFRNVGDTIQRCLPGDDCYKFEDGSWVTDSSIPTPTTPSYYPAYPDRTLTNYQMGTPKAPMYAHGATVWNKRLADAQMSAAYVVGPDTKGTQVKNTYPDRMSGAENPTNYKIGDYIPTGMDYKSPAAGTHDYNKDVQPYYTMRLHAPDTRRMAYGGYVPAYKSGGFLRQAGEFAFGALEGTLDTVTGGLTDSLTDMAHDALADAAGTTYDDKAGQRLKRLHGAGKIGGAITGGIVSGNVAGAISQGAEGGQDILQASPNASEDLKKWGGLGLNLAQMGSGFMGGANNPTQMANFNASDIGKFAGQAGKAGQGFNMFQSGNVMGMMNMFQPQGMGSFRNGGRITGKYNPPGLRWQQLNPGVSAPEGVYTGPTTQRGITFAAGGDVEVLELKPSISGGASSFWQKGAYELPMMGGNISGNFGGKYNPYLKGYAGLGNTRSGIISGEAGVSPHIKAGKFIINPSATMGLTGGIKRRQDIYTTDPSGNITQQTTDPTLAGNIYSKAKLKALYTDVSKDLNFKPYMSAEVTKDPYGTRLPISAGLDFGRDTFVQGSYDPLSNTFGVGAQFNFGGEKNPYKYKAKRKIPTSRYNPTFADGGPIYNWIPDYPRTGAKNAQGGWLDMYDEGGDVEDVEEKEASNKKQNIVNLQTKLKQAGIYKGVIDGIYGPNTEKAHVAYNKKNVENKASIFPTDFTRNVMTKLLPLNAGVFLGDLIGATGDITESNLKDSELEALQNIVRTNLKKGKPYIEYEDYNTGSKYGDVSKGNFSVKRVGKAIQKEFNPNYNLKTTLGQANIITTPTDTFVVDQYNFNNKDLVTLKDVASEGLSNLDPYTGMRNIGALYGSGPGQGSKVKIKTTQKSNTSGWLDFFD